jgi:hypothetical protein
MNKNVTKKRRSVIFDIPNIAFEVAAVNKPDPSKNKNMGTDNETLAGLCMHILFTRVQKFFRDLNPDFIVFAFENKNNWRKAYTSSEDCVSKNPYKGNRVYDSSMEYYFKMLDAFKETCTHHTSIICLTAEGLEGDDLIAGYSQLYAKDDHEVIIISGDKDFIQLLKNPNVKLLNQRDGKYRNQPGDKLYWENLDYFIFEKCIRGDKKDYVFSALPNVRSTRLEKAFNDEYEFIKLMNETWSIEKDGTEITYKVEDLYNENKLLLDLTCQPPEVREYMFDIIKHQVNNFNKYSNFHFLKFLGQFQLKKITEEIQKFQDIFVRNADTTSGKFIKEALNKRKDAKSGNDDSNKNTDFLVF